MNKRLLTAALAVGLAALASPANARPTDVDGDATRGYGYGYDNREQRIERSERSERPRAARRGAQRSTAKPRRRSTGGVAARSGGIAARSVTGFARGTGAARGCLTSQARALLGRIESQFGAMQVISTCRPGARVAGTGRISKHASGQAIDFNAGSRKGEVLRWLVANHKSGGTMTYAGMSHIHVDVGYHFVALNSGGRRRR